MKDNDYEQTAEEEAEELTEPETIPDPPEPLIDESVYEAISTAIVKFRNMAQEARSQANLKLEREYLDLAESLDDVILAMKTVLS